MADNSIDLLSRLIHLNKRLEENFCAAAQNVRNSELESMFGGYAKRHAKFAAELEQEIKRLDGAYSGPGAVGGALHRSWMDLKSALSGHSAEGLLTSCESGEESAEVAYQDATDANPTGQTHALLDRQQKQIKEFRTRLARLAAEMKNGLEFRANE